MKKMAPYKTVLLYALLFVVVTSSVTSQEDKDDLPLPELPDQFYMNIEANINSFNQTIYLEEIYDGPGNRGAAFIYFRNTTTFITYDYNNLQQISVTWAEGEPKCNVSELTNSRTNVFGFHYEGKQVHINSTADFLRFGKQFNETYLGQDEVRGIPVDHWVTNIPHDDGSSIDLHYYFTIKGYHSATNGTQVLVRATINGTSSSHRPPYNGTHPVSNVYEFFDVHLALPWWKRPFEPPLGLSCIGRKSHKELPKLPNQFSMRGEVMTSVHKKVIPFSAYYNYPGNVTSFSFHLPGRNQTKTVHDFNYGLTYSLNEDVGSCNVSTINVDGHTSPDVVISPDGSHVIMQNPTSFFLPPNLTWAYEGKSELRGLDVESWISEPQDEKWRKNKTVEVFFASVNYSISTFPSGITYFPVQRIDRGIRNDPTTNQSEKTQAILNIFAFDYNIGGLWHFDTSSCIDEEDQIPLAFDLVGSENYHTYVQNNSHYFYFGAHESIAKGAKLPGSRVAHFAVEEGNDEVLTIFFTLLGVPKIQGNAVNSSQNHSIPVTEAKENLKKLIDNNLFKITVFDGEEVKSLAVAEGSLRENFSANDEPEDGSNVGATVGVAFATFFTGLFIGLLVMVIVLKKNNVEIPYLVQK